MKPVKNGAYAPRESFALSKTFRLVATAAILALAGAFLPSCAEKTAPFAYSPAAENLAVQQFVIHTDQHEVIAGQQGSIFAIPAGAFLDANGNPVTGEVNIHLREANTLKDILNGGLITQTGDHLLASDGMYKIEAFQGESALTLNPKIGIYAYLPNDGRDPNMNLYVGQMSEDKLDWRLSENGEEGLLNPADKAVSKQCKKCERLIKMVEKVKPGKKPTDDEYWAKRHYWKNGVLYFYSSGSSKAITSEKSIEECRDYLEQSKRGQAMLAKVDQLKKDQIAGAASYYNYRITSLGWYNCDKLVKDELVTFRGKVTDEDGDPVAGAKVHLLCTDADMRIHTATTTQSGDYELKFIPGRSFRLYAFHESAAGRTDIKLEREGQDMGPLAINTVESLEEMDRFMSDLQ